MVGFSRTYPLADLPSLQASPLTCTLLMPFLPFLLDETIKADINQWRVKLDNYSTQALGRTIVYLDGTTQTCRFKECNMGNLICDAMVSRLQGHSSCI